jgi:chemotaxis response regulator CheB
MFVHLGSRANHKRNAIQSSVTTAIGRKTAAAANRFELLTGDDLASMFGFITGTTLVSQQTSAPTGWTKGATHNDKAIRIVTGTVSTGGTNAFSTVFASHTPTAPASGAAPLSTAQNGSHTHSRTSVATVTNTTPASLSSGTTAGPTISTGNAGGGGGHTHSFTGVANNFAVQFVDVIIITKN